MALDNLSEDLFQAIDTIVQARIANLPYDKTIECEVIEKSKDFPNSYLVKYQNATFTATTTIGSLEPEELVYVSVPENDFKQDKIIIAKKQKTDVQVVKYLPFLSFVKGNNLFSEFQQNNEYAIPVNNKKTVSNSFVFTRFENEDLAAGYTRLGLKFMVSTTMGQSVVSGDYGVCVTIRGYDTRTSALSSATLLSRVRDPELSDAYSKEFFLKKEDMIIVDPYNTHGYQNQEKVFDISGWVIDTITVNFWQNNDFKDSFGASIDGALVYFSNLQLYLGYDTDDFSLNNTALRLYTMDGLLYNSSNLQKKIQIKLVTKEEDDNNLLDGNYMLSTRASYYHWERYNELKVEDTSTISSKLGFEEFLTAANRTNDKYLNISINASTNNIKTGYVFTYRDDMNLDKYNFTSNELWFYDIAYQELLWQEVSSGVVSGETTADQTLIKGTLIIEGNELLFKTTDGVTVLKLSTKNSELNGKARVASNYEVEGTIYQNLKAIETALNTIRPNSYTVI